jgi:hypothetical protein
VATAERRRQGHRVVHRPPGRPRIRRRGRRVAPSYDPTGLTRSSTFAYRRLAPCKHSRGQRWRAWSWSSRKRPPGHRPSFRELPEPAWGAPLRPSRIRKRPRQSRLPYRREDRRNDPQSGARERWKVPSVPFIYEDEVRVVRPRGLPEQDDRNGGPLSARALPTGAFGLPHPPAPVIGRLARSDPKRRTPSGSRLCGCRLQTPAESGSPHAVEPISRGAIRFQEGSEPPIQFQSRVKPTHGVSDVRTKLTGVGRHYI